MPWSILYIKRNLEWSLRTSNGFQPRISNIEEGLPLEYCVGDSEVMTLAISGLCLKTGPAQLGHINFVICG